MPWYKNYFHITGPWWRVSTSYMKGLYFLSCHFEQTVEQTVNLLVIWNVVTLMWLHCCDDCVIPFPNLHFIYNSMRPSDEYMRQCNMPTLLQIKACCLFCAKPLPEPILPFCQLDPKELVSVKFYLKFNSFLIKEMHLKMSSAKVAAILPGLNMLIPCGYSYHSNKASTNPGKRVY